MEASKNIYLKFIFTMFILRLFMFQCLADSFVAVYQQIFVNIDLVAANLIIIIIIPIHYVRHMRA